MKNIETPKNTTPKNVKFSTIKLVFGIIFMAIALMLCISFVSYLNNWQEDQSQLGSMLDKSVKSSNFLGKLGDWLGNIFIFASFGITAFVIPFLLVVLGSILLGIKYFKLWKSISHSLFFACWLPVFIGAITKGNGVMSGVYGYQVYDYGVTIIGSFGLWVCIILSIFIYFILEFNLSSESISGNIQDIKDRVKSELDRRLDFIDFARVHFISALHGSGVGNLFESVREAYTCATQKMTTSMLTRILQMATDEHQPPMISGRRIKLKYAHPGGYNPPIIVVHGNQPDKLPDSYKRYLSNYYRKSLRIIGSPIRLLFQEGNNPFAGKRNTLTPTQLRKRKRLMKFIKKAKR